MVIKSAKFELSVMNKSQYPTNRKPEIVLAGKSNVGKSSFINSMLNRKSLARTSSAPGKTRQLNFYLVNEQFYFVDLPGYGYSEMSKAEQEKVATSVNSYLKNRKSINLIILIVDIRHKPTANDIQMLEYIKSTDRRYIVLASKADKIAKTKVNSYVEDIAKALDVPLDLIFPYSSESKAFVESTWEIIEESLAN
ncbi:MAG: YihA family ribosome biogenesis GTP-binding protein [Clostridia bacterium]|nr:YihA family ribosome biogenesis GTP-binding protein [Clostridia bacterium]